MIDLGVWRECVCKKFNNIQYQCMDQYTITEQGKSVRLAPGSGELVLAIILDGCVIKDKRTRCDALYLYKRSPQKYSFLVEVKGAGDIRKAFYQLSYTRERNEYREILQRFVATDNRKVFEKFAIVSNGMLSKPELERLENEYQIRVRKILHCEGTTPIPDLKDLI